LTPLDIPPFELSEKDLDERFEALQRRLIPLWKSIRELTKDEQTIVVLPSLTVDFPMPGSLQQAYEERFLFLLLLLRQPNAQLVYLSSQKVNPTIVDYYLGLLPGVITSHARRRLHFISPQDGSEESLAAKLLKRPPLLDVIRKRIGPPERAHMVPFITTGLERDLALRLGVPIYGANPKYAHLGTKSGCRGLFSECNVSHPFGFENLKSRDDLRRALAELKKARPECQQAMVKHDEGVSGAGNACIEVAAIDPESDASLDEAIDTMVLEAHDLTHQEYLVKLEAGGILEERVHGKELRSPSAQLRITPLREVQLISTHDQLLAGPSGQKFTGCLFPADERYAALIADESLRVGERLAEEGVLGRFAIDYVVAHRDDGWHAYAIEINLRKGGTTHPFLTLQFLTDGHYDGAQARFIAKNGDAKYFIASDNVENEAYRVFRPEDLFDVAVREGLHFDQSKQTGVVFHMLTALGDHGRLGLTAVGGSHSEAKELYDQAVRTLDEEAAACLAPEPLAPR